MIRYRCRLYLTVPEAEAQVAMHAFSNEPVAGCRAVRVVAIVVVRIEPNLIFDWMLLKPC